MTSAALPYDIPRPRGTSGAVLMAILMHGLLFALLFVGVRWQSQAPATIEAELWSAVPQIAASAPPPPQPVEAPPRPVQPEAIEPEPVKPDIAIKQEVPKKKPPRVVQKPEPKPEPKPLPKPLPKPETKPPLKVPPKVQTVEKSEPRAPSESIQRLLAQAGAAPNNGNADRTAGSRGDDAYGGAIRAKILSNLRFPLPPDLSGNPEAVFMIEQLPSGEIIRVTKRKSSGLPAFDAAVERAIEASSPLPRRPNGKVDPTLELVFHPQDKQ